MRTIGFIIQKEFLQIFRSRDMLPIIFIMPLVQLIVLAYAATFEIRNIDVFVIDRDMTPASRHLTRQFAAADNFRIVEHGYADAEGMEALLDGRAKLVVHLPAGLARDLGRGEQVGIQLSIDAVDGYAAGVSSQYARGILERFNQQLHPDARYASGRAPPRITVGTRHWYNPDLDFKIYMVPGILVVLITMIGGALSGMNVVREKELGTIEQLNVTPINKWQFIAGKLLPFWILALVELSIGLIVAWLIFSIPFEGSLLLIYVLAAIYLLAILGLGLLISTMADTQQQSIFITWFVMVVFILMGGLFTPIESMPDWAQRLTLLNPVAWFIDVMRRVMLVGSGVRDVLPSIFALLVFAVTLITAAVMRYRKVAG